VSATSERATLGYGPFVCLGIFENSPAIYGWVTCQTNQTSPVRDERNILPSLTGLGKLGCEIPSHKWLGYFHTQVKQKDKAGRPDIDAFEAMMMREDCEKGFFVSFDYSSDALREIESFFKRSHKVIVALTVREILDEQVARKLV
jgi:hypothetical protein